MPNVPVDFAPLSVVLLRDVGPERERCERELDEAGLSLHLFDRVAWARARRFGKPWLLAVQDDRGRCRGAVSLVAHRSRALPGHLVVRAEKCGAALPPETIHTAVSGLRALARSPRVLRLSVELFAREIGERAPFSKALADNGFHRAPQTHHYTATLRVDLTPNEATILASFSRSARQRIKGLANSDFELRPIADARYVSRLDALAREAMERTGAEYIPYEHAAMAELTASQPGRSRLVGVFRRGDDAPESLVAYAWSGLHGDHAGYDVGAATRIPGVNVGFSYPLLWDLMCWGKARGARWFDMGGVSDGGLNTDDPVGGISDFKRYFTKDLATVAEDWMLEPHPSSAALARMLSNGAKWLARSRK
jgi:hypothetical protein